MVVYGCGGHARSIINAIREIYADVNIILIDENARAGEVILGCEVKAEYDLQEEDGYVVAIGDNHKRKALYQKLIKGKTGRCISLTSLSAHIGIESQIGHGTFIAAHAYVGPQVTIGSNTIVNTASVIEHEVQIGDHSHVAPHATVCGRVKIGNNVFCGAGSIVIDKVSVCDDVVIGAGAVVKENIVELGTYVGVPAKKIG